MSNPLDKIANEPLTVKHLLWAMGVFKAIIALLTWFVLWYLNNDIQEAVAPLQTKEEWRQWQDKKFDPHIEKFNHANIDIGIILDRTNSKHRTMTSGARPEDAMSIPTD